jgi:hypothetical protein
MSAVPYIFAGDTGNIPLSQLDANFANCKAFADTAGNVTGNVQANITGVGALTSLSVIGNIVSLGFITGNGSLLTGVNNYTNANVAAFLPGYTGNLSAAAGSFSSNVEIDGSLVVNGNLEVDTNAIIYGNLTVQGTTFTQNSNTVTTNDLTITVGNNQSTGTALNGAGLLVGNSNIATWLFSNPTNSWTTNLAITPTGNAVANLGATTRYWNNFFTTNVVISGTITAPTPANTTSNTQVATTAFVRNIIPTGLISMWSGSVLNIPSGWLLCDGTSGTPDLRDRFVVGAGSTYLPGTSGGSANAVVVSHNHTATSTVTDPGHTHATTFNQTSKGQNATPYMLSNPFIGENLNGSVALATNSNVTGITVATTVVAAGVSGVNANLPPYYALAYIMKT